VDKLKTLIDGIARIESKIDGLQRDRRLKVSQHVIDLIIEMHRVGLKPSEINRRLLLLHQVKVSDPTVRKVIKAYKDTPHAQVKQA
jgi:hypothetical protein